MKVKKYIRQFFAKLEKINNSGKVFGNISEGTHAGAITLIAAENIDLPHLAVCFEEGNSGKIKVAGVGDKPLGICDDSGLEGEGLNVILPGSAESSVLCLAATSINAGDSVYGAPMGKVSAFADAGCYKIGVALCDCNAGGIVEVDTKGFGERAWQVSACSEYVWESSASSENVLCAVAKEGDVVLASISKKGGSETRVSASVANGGGQISFVLDAAGSAGNTKISWALISAN